MAMSVAAEGTLKWQPWTADLFAKAKAENRFVILDLEAVWCHWCHVMAATTYQDPKVVGLLQSRYVPVRVDQDAHPDLANRYGDWGWPATIIFAPDGTEIVKRRGYIRPEAMASLLDAVIADPSPGPSVRSEPELVPAEQPILSEVQRAALSRRFAEAYDGDHGGWGSMHKFIDPDSMDHVLAAAERGDSDAAARARQTLSSASHLIDREAGGLYQYSDAIDWKSPHYEKIMSYQASGLRQFAAAYGLWRDPAHLAAAQDLHRYLTTVLLSPDGAFYTSQDADLDAETSGKTYYALSQAERRKLGRHPRVDTNSYARENGWAISGLLAYADATDDTATVAVAERAANWVLANRRRNDGGFHHGEKDRGGPYLGDTLAMGTAALDLYATTGRRAWLDVAREAGSFIEAKFRDPAGGFLTTLTPEGSTGVFLKPAKPIEEQIAATRFANRLHRYLGEEKFRGLAEHGMRTLASDKVITMRRTLPGVLLAADEVAHEPTHMTVVGSKDDPAAVALHAAARAYPALYKRVDWWDPREGPLPNPDVTYPELDRAAAFACTNRICSQPAFTGPELMETVKRLQALRTGGG